MTTVESYVVIYSQHMWLCTCPAYETVHMRSFDIGLYMNSGQLSCSFSQTSGHWGTTTAAQEIFGKGSLVSLLSEFVNIVLVNTTQSYSSGSCETRPKLNIRLVFLNQRQVQRCVVVKNY